MARGQILKWMGGNLVAGSKYQDYQVG